MITITTYDKHMYQLQAVGSDPEFFLADENNKPVTAIGRIGGTKHEPKFINDDGSSAVQEDNVMVEFNIAPARTADDFVHNHLVVMAYLDKAIKQQTLVPLVKPAVKFSKRDLKHPQAKEIGCMPDFSAWTLHMNEKHTPAQLGRWRVAGGHVHVSYTLSDNSPLPPDQVAVVRQLDLALGVPAVLLDTDKVRRKFYGKAGCYRPKDYGVEYRTLSNFWIADRALMTWVFNQVIWAFMRLKDFKSIGLLDEPKIQKAINFGDQALAKQLIEFYKIPMPC